VLYKQHPFIGIVNPKAARAHRRIIAVLEKAAAERAAKPEFAALAAAEAE
jgi:hypothetical protein